VLNKTSSERNQQEFSRIDELGLAFAAQGLSNFLVKKRIKQFGEVT
jgi:hypothetical protein